MANDMKLPDKRRKTQKIPLVNHVKEVSFKKRQRSISNVSNRKSNRSSVRDSKSSPSNKSKNSKNPKRKNKVQNLLNTKAIEDLNDTHSQSIRSSINNKEGSISSMYTGFSM